jgi:hypothetical protein
VGERTSRNRSIRRSVGGPDGSGYVLQAAPSGFIEWSPAGYQPLIGWFGHVVGTTLVNRLVFRGLWTLVVWRGDAIAPKRTTVHKQRYRTRAEATAALEDLARTIPRRGLP